MLTLVYYILEGSGFVYGFMTFVERIFNGGIIILMQNRAPDVSTSFNTQSEYFRWVLVFGCGVPVISTLIVLLILWPIKIGQRQSQDRS